MGSRSWLPTRRPPKQTVMHHQQIRPGLHRQPRGGQARIHRGGNPRHPAPVLHLQPVGGSVIIADFCKAQLAVAVRDQFVE